MTESPSVPSGRRFLRGFSVAVLVLICLSILISLGTWQVRRMYWKEQLLSDMQQRRTMPPVTIDGIEADLASGVDVEYRRVRLSGVFDHTRERHFFATHQGATGYYIYTPLTMDDGRIVFVNRGFVPFEMKDASTRMQGQIAGKVTVDGLFRNRLPGKPSSLVPDNDSVKNIFYWKDIDAMIASTGLDASVVLPFFVDAGPEAVAGGWPQGGVTLFDLPNNHLQYAITWYGLAAALALVAGFAYFRGTRAGDLTSQKKE